MPDRRTGPRERRRALQALVINGRRPIDSYVIDSAYHAALLHCEPKRCPHGVRIDFEGCWDCLMLATFRIRMHEDTRTRQRNRSRARNWIRERWIKGTVTDRVSSPGIAHSAHIAYHSDLKAVGPITLFGRIITEGERRAWLSGEWCEPDGQETRVLNWPEDFGAPKPETFTQRIARERTHTLYIYGGGRLQGEDK